MSLKVRWCVLLTSLQLEDPGVTVAQKEEAKRKASAFYQLAEGFCQPTTGRLTCMRGLSGTGKSTIAQEVAMHHDAVILRADAIRKHLFNVPLNEHRDDIYTNEHTTKTFHHIASIAGSLLASGYHVIIDATLLKQWQQALFYSLSEKHGVHFHILDCIAPDEIIRKRLQKRKNSVSDANERVYELQLKNREPIQPSLEQYTLVIDTTQPIDASQLKL